MIVMMMVVGCGSVATLKNGEQKVASFTKGGISADSLYKKMKTKYGAQEFIDLLDTEILNKKYKPIQDGFKLTFSKELLTTDDAIKVAEVIDKIILLYIVENKK